MFRQDVEEEGDDALAVGAAMSGNRTTNSLPFPGVLLASTLPPCIETNRSTKANPMPKPALRSVQRPVCLRKQIEDTREKFRSDPDAGISHTNDRLLAFLLRREPDATAVVRVLGGVVEKVHDELLDPGCVRMKPDRRCRQRYRKCVPALVDQRTGGFNRTFENSLQHDSIGMKLNSPGGDARHFQQIIHESGQLSHLPFDNRAGLLLDGIIVRLETKDRRIV